MPEGDTIHRAAAALDRALAGRAVVRFESVLPRLTRVDVDHPLKGRKIERVSARGKHLLIWFSDDLVLRTHMRMKGAWHLYRPGERWRRPHRDMRIVIATESFEAVAFNVPVAEFGTARETDRTLTALGPDPLAQHFDDADAVRRLEARGGMSIADALLDQRAIAGIGNVYKSEVLFGVSINPFTPVDALSHGDLEQIVSTAQRMMRANTSGGTPGGSSMARRTTGWMHPSARLWVYGRGGQPCRRCGLPIQRSTQGAHARVTYWCERCQPSR